MTSGRVVLRAATEADVPALVRLLRRSWLVTWAPELPFEAVQAFAAADPARSHAETCWPGFVVAAMGGEVVGMVHAVADRVEDVHVDPRARGGGIGTMLMDEAERLIAEGNASATLAVRAFNEHARVFYARRGWVEVGRFTATECGSPVETIEMRKTLRAPPNCPRTD